MKEQWLYRVLYIENNLCVFILASLFKFFVKGHQWDMELLRMYCIVRPMVPENNVTCTYYCLHVLSILGCIVKAGS